MSEHPSLAEVIEQALDDKQHADLSIPFARGRIAASITARWAIACTITTTEQLNALPTGAFVRDAYGQIMERRRGKAWWRYSEKQLPLELPALLIWHPEWTA